MFCNVKTCNSPMRRAVEHCMESKDSPPVGKARLLFFRICLSQTESIILKVSKTLIGHTKSKIQPNVKNVKKEIFRIKNTVI